jgi:hypothetical protein
MTCFWLSSGEQRNPAAQKNIPELQWNADDALARRSATARRLELNGFTRVYPFKSAFISFDPRPIAFVFFLCGSG